MLVLRCCSALSNPLRLHGLRPTRLHCPWNFPGKNTGMGCHFLLQGIFPAQGSILHLLHWQADSLLQCHMGNPLSCEKILKIVLKATTYRHPPELLSGYVKESGPCGSLFLSLQGDGDRQVRKVNVA